MTPHNLADEPKARAKRQAKSDAEILSFFFMVHADRQQELTLSGSDFEGSMKELAESKILQLSHEHLTKPRLRQTINLCLPLRYRVAVELANELHSMLKTRTVRARHRIMACIQHLAPACRHMLGVGSHREPISTS